MQVERGTGYVALVGECRVLSSAAYRGGLTEADAVVNLQVEKGYRGEPADTLHSFCQGKGWRAVGLLTAADVSRAVVTERGTVRCVATAGLSNASRAGTINLLLAVDADLEPGAMANLLQVATEAKVLALHDLDARSPDGLATGTSTDTVAVACYGETPVRYGGLATPVGRAVQEAVREALLRALADAEGLAPRRPLLDRLAERGVSREDLEGAAFALWEAPGGRSPGSHERRAFWDTLERAVRDDNVRSLWEAAFGASEAWVAGRLAGKDDPAALLADELLGQLMAEYVGGKRALFNFFRYDAEKPGVLGQLDPFLDDALAGLLAGCMTRALEAAP